MPWVIVGDLYRGEKGPSEREIAQVLDYARRRAKPRFLADENFPPLVGRILEGRGGRVTTVQEIKRRGHPDENHAAYALAHGLILVTCDRDYLDERRFPLIHCPAIVVFDFGSGNWRDTLSL